MVGDILNTAWQTNKYLLNKQGAIKKPLNQSILLATDINTAHLGYT